MKKAVITLVVFIALSAITVQAQNEETKPKAKITDNMSITPALGLLHFYGDIRQYDFFPVTKYQNENKFGFPWAQCWEFLIRYISPVAVGFVFIAKFFP